MTYPNVYATQTGPLALSGLDANFLYAVDINNAALTATAGGSADALTATYSPAPAALVAGLTLYLRAAQANATTTPQFSPNGLTGKVIVKNNNQALSVGDISGAGHWLQLVYDATNGVWELMNPALAKNIAGGTQGQVPVQSAVGTTTFMDSSFAFKNRFINGSIGISQRTAVNTNVAVSTTASGTFGPDRFWGFTGVASLWNISQVSTSAYDFPFALRLQRIAGQTSTSAIYAGQLIETNNCKDLAGQAVTLSFYATAGANYSGGAVSVSVFTGTAADQGTTSLNSGTWTGFASPINSTFTPTTTRTLFTFTGTLGSTIQEVAFRLQWSGSGTAGAADYLDITGVQLEKGSTATSFDYRPYGAELALCQRYFYKTFPQAVAPAQNTNVTAGTIYYIVVLGGANYMGTPVYFPVTMRATPTTLTFYNPQAANAKWRNTSTGADSGPTTSPQNLSQYGFLAINNPQVVGDLLNNSIIIHATAEAEL